jgi:hypothetical protein
MGETHAYAAQQGRTLDEFLGLAVGQRTGRPLATNRLGPGWTTAFAPCVISCQMLTGSLSFCEMPERIKKADVAEHPKAFGHVGLLV